MSVQSEIDRIITAVGNAYSKVSEKGGTVPASQTVANLATAIDSIPSGGAGFKVTFPATAANWGFVDPNNAYILLADGTFKSIKDYSTIGGKTIENVAGILVHSSEDFSILRMTLSAGVIAQLSVSVGTSSYFVTTAPNTTTSQYVYGRTMFWWPVADTVISKIEMYNAD